MGSIKFNIVWYIHTSIILSLANGAYTVAVDSKLAHERDSITDNLASLITEIAMS